MTAPDITTTLPTGQWCPIGPLNLHTYNYERDECIWCGPNRLASKPGRWVPLSDGTSAWSATPPTVPTPGADQ